MCCSPWSCKELDTTLRLNNNSNKISWTSWVSFSQVVNDPNEWAGHFSWGQLYPKYMGWNRRRADGFRDLGWGTCRGACHPVKSKSCPLSSYRGRGGGCSVSSPILEPFPVGEMTLVLFSYWPLVLMTEIAQVLDWEAQVSLRDCHFSSGQQTWRLSSCWDSERPLISSVQSSNVVPFSSPRMPAFQDMAVLVTIRF